jgi:hypothetical protein
LDKNGKAEKDSYSDNPSNNSHEWGGWFYGGRLDLNPCHSGDISRLFSIFE